MEDAILKKLEHLDKYMPFIDYLLDVDNDKYVKFRKIKHWIKTKKRYPLETLERIEQSIIITYKNLFLERKPPKDLIDLFNQIFVVKYVDLCSDEEKDVDDTDENNRIVAEPCPPKSSDASENQSNAIVTSDVSENTNISIQIEDEETSQRIPSTEQMGTNMECVRKENELQSAGSEPNNRVENCENYEIENFDNESDATDTSKLFKRRKDLVEPNKEKIKKMKKKHKIKKDKKTPTPNVCEVVISIDSTSDDENIENIDASKSKVILQDMLSAVHCETLKINKNSPEKEASLPPVPSPIITPAIVNAKAIENNTLKEGNVPESTDFVSAELGFAVDQTKSTSINLPASIVTDSVTNKAGATNENSLPSINISNSSRYENMNIDQLSRAYEDLKEKTGIELDNYLDKLVNDLDTHSLESKTNDKHTTGNEANCSSSDLNCTGNNILAQRSCAPFIYYNNNSTPNLSHPYLAFQYQNHQNMFYPYLDQRQLPHVPKINLNDPRIIKRLREIVESPNHSKKARATAADLSNRIPTTYGEHKRQKAQEELKLRKMEENRLKEAEAVREKEKSELETNELKKQEQIKQTSNIKEILLNTLQPHRDKIEDMLRKNNATKSPTEKSNYVDKQHPNTVYFEDNLSNNLNTTNTHQNEKNTAAIPPSNKNIPPQRRKSICKSNKEHNNSSCNRNSNTANAKEIESKTSTTKKTRRKSVCENRAKALSSSDTDTFDFESFLVEKLKLSALKNPPVVLLHRLTESNIPKHKENVQLLQSEVAKHTLEVQLVEDTSKTISEKLRIGSVDIAMPKPKLKRPNTDSRMTEQNTLFCVLCKTKPSNLTNHYLRKHKTESYVSRLTRAQLDTLRLNIPVAISVGSQYKVKCFFCEEYLVDSFLKFYNHYSTHTGEYAFKCSNCGLQKPFRVDIQSHQQHSKACRITRIQNLYLYQANIDVIYLHCCRICNFVQLNEANVLKHLRDHHDKQHDNTANVQKYILAKIYNGDDSDRTLDCNSFEAETSFELYADDGVTVSNAAICEEEVNLAEEIKPEIENLLVNINTDKFSGKDIMPKLFEISLPTASAQQSATDAVAFSSATSSSGVISQALIINRPIHMPIFLPLKNEDIKPDIKGLESQLGSTNEVNTHSTSKHQSASQIRNCIPIQNYKTYPKEKLFFGLHKCMVAGCLFSSNIDDEMLKHLNSSDCSGKDGFLNCAYCQLDANSFDSPEMLVIHSRDKHLHNRFQCPKCSYRSCIPGNVLIHCQHVHNNEEDASNLVYECEGQAATFNEQSPQRIEMLMSANIHKLQCPHCSEGFYAIKSMTEHLKQVYKGDIIDISGFERFACIYCTESSNDDAYMQKHLALKHPDEIPYACERVLKPKLEVDSVKNLETRNISLHVPPHSIVSVNELQSRMCPPSSTIPHSESQNALTTSTIDSSQCSNNGAVTTESISTDLNSDTSIFDDLEAKPDLEQLININVDVLKPLLLKLTANTGVSWDVLYRCPKSDCNGYFSIFEHWSRHMVGRHQCIIAICPHCGAEESGEDEMTAELPLADFEQHFEQHRRHMFVCFHCGETFANEDSLREHAAGIHVEIKDLRMEKVAYTISYSYHVLIDSSLNIDRLKFLLELREVVVNRLQCLEAMESERIISQWLVPSTASWLDDFPNYRSLKQREKRCIKMECSFHAPNAEELFAHVRSSHKIFGHVFKCNRCDFKINSNTWDPILEHIQMHDSNIYVCCVCSYYHFDRCKMSHHIRDNHDSRDVPVLNLLRSEVQIHVSIAVVYSTKRCTFSTMNSCFCCPASNLDPGTLGIHLKKAHKMTLRYFCELCHEHLPKLQHIDEHFTGKHTLDSLKIRCELATSNQLTIKTVMPLRVKLNRLIDPILPQLTSVKRSSKSMECEDVTQQPPNKVQKTTSCPVIIKQEQSAEDSDDCEIVDEDDIVIAGELKAFEAKQQTAVAAPGSQLKCINIQNLMSTQKSTPLISTSSPTITGVRLITPTGTMHCKNVRILNSHGIAVTPKKQTPNNATQPLKTIVGQVPSTRQQKSGIFPIPVLDRRIQQTQPQLPSELDQQRQSQNQHQLKHPQYERKPHQQNQHHQQQHRQQQHHQQQHRQQQIPNVFPIPILNQSTNQIQSEQRYSGVSTTFTNNSFCLPLTPNVPPASNQYHQQEFINCVSNDSRFSGASSLQQQRYLQVSQHSATASNAVQQFSNMPH